MTRRKERPKRRVRPGKGEGKDPKLADALLAVASGYRSHADVFALEHPVSERVLDQATAFAKIVWDDFVRCTLGDVLNATELSVSYLLADGGKLDIYPLSGAVEATLLRELAPAPHRHRPPPR